MSSERPQPGRPFLFSPPVSSEPQYSPGASLGCEGAGIGGRFHGVWPLPKERLGRRGCIFSSMAAPPPPPGWGGSCRSLYACGDRPPPAFESPVGLRADLARRRAEETPPPARRRHAGLYLGCARAGLGGGGGRAASGGGRGNTPLVFVNPASG